MDCLALPIYCRVRPLWPSAPYVCYECFIGGRPQGPHPANVRRSWLSHRLRLTSSRLKPAHDENCFGKKLRLREGRCPQRPNKETYGTVDIFRESDMSHLFWSQIRNWLGKSLHKVNSFLTKTRKTSLCQLGFYQGLLMITE